MDHHNISNIDLLTTHSRRTVKLSQRFKVCICMLTQTVVHSKIECVSSFLTFSMVVWVLQCLQGSWLVWYIDFWSFGFIDVLVSMVLNLRCHQTCKSMISHSFSTASTLMMIICRVGAVMCALPNICYTDHSFTLSSKPEDFFVVNFHSMP